MTVASEDRLPVVIGAGEATRFWDGNGPSPSPVTLACAAVERAIADSECSNRRRLREQVDGLYCVRLMRDSLPGLDDPETRYEDLPSSIASTLGFDVSTSVYSAVGGDQPQGLLHEACCDVYAGRNACVVVTGAEATAAVKTARRGNLSLEWPLTASRRSQDRGFGEMIITPYEFSKGMGLPLYSYGLIDHALRTRYGWSRADYHDNVGRLLASFSAVAAANDYAFFPTKRDVKFLRTPSSANPLIADPFLKWHMAQDAVNQGAALIVTSIATARALGVPRSQWVFMHSFAQAYDSALIHRTDLSHSPPMRAVLADALAQAAVDIGDIGALDLYSCFPSAVLLACEYLGLDPFARPLTVTGGLPFFGGPGNNYALHAIATTLARCREAPQSTGLVLANGGYLSKLSAATYSCAIPDSAASVFLSATPPASADAVVPIDESMDDGQIESFVVAHDRAGPRFALLMVRSTQGRALFRIENPDVLHRLSASDPIGMPMRAFTHDS